MATAANRKATVLERATVAMATALEKAANAVATASTAAATAIERAASTAEEYYHIQAARLV